MRYSPEYAVSLAFRDRVYVAIVHAWERNACTQRLQRINGNDARITAEASALELASRLGLPFCEDGEAVNKALARYIARSTGGNVSASNVKNDLLSQRSLAAVTHRYGLDVSTVRSIRDLVSGGSILLRP